MSTTDTTRRIGLIVLVALAFLLLVPLLLGGMGTMAYGGMGGYGPMMGGGYGPMMGGQTGGTTAVPGWVVAATLLVRLLGIAVLVVGGYLLYRAFAGSSDGDTALEELRLAYARGDLTDEEYERRRERLGDEE